MITIIYQDILDNAQHYQGVYNFKWWHVASFGIGLAIDYFYTTTHLAHGIQEIQHTLQDQSQPASEKINTIINIADGRLKQRHDRKDQVSQIYQFLSQELSERVSTIKRDMPKKTPVMRTNLTTTGDIFFQGDEGTTHIKRERSLSKDESRSQKRQPSIELDDDIDPQQPLINTISNELCALSLLHRELRDTMALEIVHNIASHNLGSASMVSNGFVDICISKLHNEPRIDLADDQYPLKPCRTVLSNEIEQGDILVDIDHLVTANANSIILLPINFGNWHFGLVTIDTSNRNIYFFDSFGGDRATWIRERLKNRTQSTRAYNIIKGAFGI
ncbi:hypothetical protein, partial [Facilibium subflavum]|uniref:hypothetical protein n=1 Tax=Facilibium subflavum TaxID=2219058 RepID=UPI0013C2F42F